MPVRYTIVSMSISVSISFFGALPPSSGAIWECDIWRAKERSQEFYKGVLLPSVLLPLGLSLCLRVSLFLWRVEDPPQAEISASWGAELPKTFHDHTRFPC
eukprot:2608070-Amphidinium_carterae.1